MDPKPPADAMFSHMPPETFAAAYTDQYNRSQVRKFLYRRGNHWAEKQRRFFDLAGKLDFEGRRMLDLGCSIGTMAVDFAGRGWEASGIDLDPRAVEVARLIAGRRKLAIDYKVADAADASAYGPGSFDLVVAGDILEHLPDPVLEKMLANVRIWLKPGGYFLFHTVPTKFDHVFHKSLLWLPLVLVAWLRDDWFTRAAKAYDRAVRAVPGLVREPESVRIVHCNLQEAAALRGTLERAGLEVLALEADTYESRFFGNRLKNRLFGAKTAYRRNLLGAAWKSFLP